MKVLSGASAEFALCKGGLGLDSLDLLLYKFNFRSVSDFCFCNSRGIFELSGVPFNVGDTGLGTDFCAVGVLTMGIRDLLCGDCCFGAGKCNLISPSVLALENLALGIFVALMGDSLSSFVGVLGESALLFVGVLGSSNMGTRGGVTSMGSLVGVGIFRGMGMIDRFFGSTVAN